MAFSFSDQLAKVEHDMMKAGFAPSAVYLALYNECKKHGDEERGHTYYLNYKKYRDLEDAQNAKDEQLTFASSMVVKHFPPEVAATNATDFVNDTLGYYACPENHKLMTDYMLKNGIAPTYIGMKTAYHQLWSKNALVKKPEQAKQVSSGSKFTGLYAELGYLAANQVALAAEKAQHASNQQSQQIADMNNAKVVSFMKGDGTTYWLGSEEIKAGIPQAPVAVAIVATHVGRKFREETP